MVFSSANVKIGFWLCVASCAWALPQGPAVVQGSLSVRNGPRELLIDLDEAKTVVNWDSFSIGFEEQVWISMPDADSSMLNRVVGGSMSEIHGKLMSNGEVWLVNPAGVYIGPTGMVETANFLAAAFDTLDEEYLFSSRISLSGKGAALVHRGHIAALKGEVRLLGKEVDLEGRIEADRVEVGAGPQFYLAKSDFYIEIDPNLQRDHAYGYAIRVPGEIKAEKGALFYSHGELAVNGSIRSYDSKIFMFGDQIRVGQGASIEAPMSEVWIGGSPRGEDPTLPHASWSIVDPGARIDVSGIGWADGGAFLLWGNDAVHFAGELRGASGASGGCGAMAEISSHGYFHCSGPIDLRGVDRSGKLLFDPVDVTITSASATSGATIGDPTTFSASPATINTVQLQSYLQSTGDVEIDATSFMGGSGDITWDNSSNVVWSSASTLSLNGRNITLGTSTIQCTSTAMGTGPRFSVTATGAIDCNGTISMSGDGANEAIHIENTGTEVASSYIGVNLANTSSISAANGDVSITGIGNAAGGPNDNHGINCLGALTIADGTTWTMTGTGGGGMGVLNGMGIQFFMGALTVGSSAGSDAALTISGTGGSPDGTNCPGVYFGPSPVTFNGGTISFVDCQGGGVGSALDTGANYGVLIGSSITSSDPASTVEFANITGGGSNAGTLNYGLSVFGAAISVGNVVMGSSDVTHIRSGTTTAAGNYGANFSGSLSATTVDLEASSLSTGNDSTGIIFSSALQIRNNGNWQLRGTGGGDTGSGSSGCNGITVDGSFSVAVGETSSGGAEIVLSGTGGTGSGGGHIGVLFSPTLTTINGPSTIHFDTCQGGATSFVSSSGNHGVVIDSAITGANAGSSILFSSIAGGGIGSGGSNYGIYVNNTELSAGTIGLSSGTITGGGGSGGNNFGMLLTGSSGSIGSTSLASTINFTATGGSQLISSGIVIESGFKIRTASTGTIALTGTAGSGGVGTPVGVSITGSGTEISSNTGLISITGSTGGINNPGVFLGSGASITSNGPITLTATGASAIRLEESITAGGAFQLLGDVTLGADVSLGGSSVYCSEDINGAFQLSIVGGSATIDGAIGQTTPVSSFFAFLTGALNLGSTFHSVGLASITSSAIHFEGNVTTNGGTISMNGPVIIDQTLSIDTTNGGAVSAGAQIVFFNSINGRTNAGQILSLRSGTTGTISVEGNIGETVPLREFSVNSSTPSVTLQGAPGVIRARRILFSKSFLNTPAITITSGGSFTFDANVGAVGLQQISIGGPVTFTSPIPVTMTGGGGNILLQDSIVGTLESFTATTTGSFSITGDITATGAVSITCSSADIQGTLTSLGN